MQLVWKGGGTNLIADAHLRSCGASIIIRANASDYDRQRCISIRIRSKTDLSSASSTTERKEGESFISKSRTLSSSLRVSSFTGVWTRGRSPHPSHVRLTLRESLLSSRKRLMCHSLYISAHSAHGSYYINIRDQMLLINISTLAY